MTDVIGHTKTLFRQAERYAQHIFKSPIPQAGVADSAGRTPPERREHRLLLGSEFSVPRRGE
ncbi:hypothetical protein CGQ24_03865 [Arthrobacter sp. 7749]|nr:hypothetical protein CGQ24_03865 [Arthrobacter sp. 7749]